MLQPLFTECFHASFFLRTVTLPENTTAVQRPPNTLYIVHVPFLFALLIVGSCLGQARVAH